MSDFPFEKSTAQEGSRVVCRSCTRHATLARRREAARRESGKETALEIPKIVGNTTQPSSRIRSEPACTATRARHEHNMPSPLDYTLPRPRVYEDKRDKNLG